jgi:hypothetical protein
MNIGVLAAKIHLPDSDLRTGPRYHDLRLFATVGQCKRALLVRTRDSLLWSNAVLRPAAESETLDRFTAEAYARCRQSVMAD